MKFLVRLALYVSPSTISAPLPGIHLMNFIKYLASMAPTCSANYTSYLLITLYFRIDSNISPLYK